MQIGNLTQEDIDWIISILEPTYSSKDTGLTPRILNDWSSKGLLENFRTDKAQWHKFSIIDLVEISIYKELRAIGFSIEKLCQIKEYFYQSSISDDDYPATLALNDIKTKIQVNNLIYNVIYTLYATRMFYISDMNIEQSRFMDGTGIASIVLGDENKTPASFIYGKNMSSIVIVSLSKILDKLGVKRIIPKTGKTNQLLRKIASNDSGEVSFNLDGRGNIKQFKIENKKKVAIDDIKNTNINNLIKSSPNAKIIISTNDDSKRTGIVVETSV